MNSSKLLPFGLFLLLLVACTPKTTETAQTTPPKEEVITPKPPAEGLSPCQNWLDLENKDEIITWHSLYRDVMKKIQGSEELQNVSAEEFEETYQNWKKVFEVAPAADGRRNTHYGDGIKIHTFLATQEKDSLKRDGHIKMVLELYDEVVRCYGREGFTVGRKAFDLYYSYPAYATDLEKYELFKRSFNLEGEKAPAFVINPFIGLLTNLVLDKQIPMEEAQEYTEKVLTLIENNRRKKTETEWKAEGWDIVAEYAPSRLENMEGMEGFYGCDYYKEKYYSTFANNPTDCDSIILVLGRLKWAKCTSEDAEAQAVAIAYKKVCRDTLVVNPCRDLLSQGRYKEAADCFEQKAKDATDPQVKATNYLIVSKIYYGELRKFSTARKYAREALKHRPNWGDPYILIGKLYASSGPLCGSGTGWPSQTVTWPAIDKWQKAKSVDPSVAKEANKLIARYRPYMPTKEDLFFRGIKVGDPFTVGCWIQERTKARTSD